MTSLIAGVALSGLVGLQTAIGIWLNFDPRYPNNLELGRPPELGGGTVSTPLVGGAHAIVIFDPVRLLSPQGVRVRVVVDEIRIAAESFEILPGLPTGTVCVVQDPETPSTGPMVLPLLGRPRISADFATRSFVTNPGLAALLPDGIALQAMIEDTVDADLRSLLISRFQMGPIAVETSGEGTVPADVPLLGEQPFAMNVRILNSFAPPQDRLLDDCGPVFAAH
jgi:hypothetical protein